MPYPNVKTMTFLELKNEFTTHATQYDDVSNRRSELDKEIKLRQKGARAKANVDLLSTDEQEALKEELNKR